MGYDTPQALRAALTSLARRHAREYGLAPGELVDRFYYQRLLARVFHHAPDDWLLKGGQALLVRYPTARHSRDIDLFHPDTTDIDHAARLLVDAAGIDLGDHLRCTLRKRATPVEGGVNARLTFDITAGVRSAGTINVDVVVGLSPHGAPVHQQLQPTIPLEWPHDWPTVKLYPILDHAADKICALYERHGSHQLASTRYRDLVDLILIALHESIDGQQLQTALRSEEIRRRRLGTNLELPRNFHLPRGPQWAQGYRAAAADVAKLGDYRTIEAAAAIANRFLDPILSAQDPGVWAPSTQAWQHRR